MEKYNTKSLIFPKPVLGFAAYSGTGKTTLLVKLLPLMKLQGLRVAMIKQTHHDFDIDKPGKDSFKLRKAGADQVLLASDKRCVLMTEYEERVDPDLISLVEKLDLENIDLIMVEGFKHSPYAKIELHRAATGKKLIHPEDDSVIAIASDVNLETGELPLLDINVPEEVAGFINRWLDHQG
ncbi:MAG: molybdopterin-guanine dinucleotide biosynthesis protein B, partial [Gammaproteobacteria bacterium]|nr:molybdopterin-guanine dinucleotide biosynthesis protein B [Gammaproteobacteria bacterium]